MGGRRRHCGHMAWTCCVGFDFSRPSKWCGIRQPRSKRVISAVGCRWRSSPSHPPTRIPRLHRHPGTPQNSWVSHHPNSIFTLAFQGRSAPLRGGGKYVGRRDFSARTDAQHGYIKVFRHVVAPQQQPCDVAWTGRSAAVSASIFSTIEAPSANASATEMTDPPSWSAIHGSASSGEAKK